MAKKIKVDLSHALKKQYNIRSASPSSISYEITLPKIAIEREAARMGMTVEEYSENFDGLWSFNSFQGLHLDFIEKNEVEKDEPRRKDKGKARKVGR